MISTDSNALRRARRSAFKAKTSLPCVSCLAYGGRCKQGRPCSRCTKLSKACVPTVSDDLDQKYSLICDRFPLSISSQHIALSEENLQPIVPAIFHRASSLGAAGIYDARDQDRKQRWCVGNASSSSNEKFMALVDTILEASGQNYANSTASEAFAGVAPVSDARRFSTAERISVRQLVHCDESEPDTL